MRKINLMKYSIPKNLFFASMKSILNLRPLVLICIIALVISACDNTEKSTFDASGERQIPLQYATGLQIWENENGYRIQVRNPQDTTEILGNYLLSRKDDDQPAAGEWDAEIAIPVKKAALNSTTFVPFFLRIGEAKTISGLTFANLMKNETIAGQIADGTTIELTSGGETDFEKMLALDADIFMVYKFGEADFERYSERGIPVVMNMEFMESTPLARAEWIKLAGCLTGKYEEARKVFEEVSQSYNELIAKAAKADSMPTVFSGMKYGANWFTPGNQSFVAQFIRDAHGKYSFEHVEGQGNKELDFESVLETIEDADYWGMLVSSDKGMSFEGVKKIDRRFSAFKSFREGQIFVCNTAKTDYFGDAVMEPEKILGDMIGIMHPQILPDHQFNYFFPITK